MKATRGAAVVLTALAALLMASCQKQAKNSLIGSWEVGDGTPVAPAPTTFYFKEGGTGASGVGGPPRWNSWKVVDQQANALTVELQPEDARRGRTLVLRVADDNHLQWVLPHDLGTVSLKRSTEPADEAVPGADDPAAVEALKKAGVTVESDSKGRTYRVVFSGNVKPQDQNAAIPQVAKLPATRTLSLSFCRGVTDAGLNGLKGLTNLRTLTLSDTGITDGAVKSLGTLTGLANLGLKGTKVTDKGLAGLSKLHQLLDLDLEGTAVTDEGLTHLIPLFGLEVLNLSDTKVKGEGLASLKGQPYLVGLYLNKSKVDDAGLAHVKHLNALKALYLVDTAVTDAGLAHLEGLGDLTLLHLGGTKATDTGVAKLQAALPNCKVYK